MPPTLRRLTLLGVAGWEGVAGKRVLITGATRGIGLAAARELAWRGASLCLVARDRARAEAALAEIRAAAGSSVSVDVLFADLALQASVRQLAGSVLERYPRLDALVNNAGAVYSQRRLTSEGVELTWAVNHVAPFLLTTLLLDRLKASAPARVVTTSSEAHRGAHLDFDDLSSGRLAYGPMGFGRYGQTKLANILFTRELARRLTGSGVEAYCFHPGVVGTGFNRNNGALMQLGMTLIQRFSRAPDKGAETLVWLLEVPSVPGGPGGYFFDMKPMQPSAAALDDTAARRLWQASEAQAQASASP
jgi:NAD(P)-dependent dehydrogenase (short-subunit alcohol dehydrogenase family)